MDFRVGMNEPTIRTDIDTIQLNEEICEEPASPENCTKHYHEKVGSSDEALEGRILIIEDLTKEVVELLGTVLDIDPLFFALHLHTVQRTGSRHQTPDEATLPSRLSSQDFVNISYHRAVISDTPVPSKGRFKRDTTIDRKLVFLRSTRIGLAQHCASVIRVKTRKGRWLALVLVDPPIGDVYIADAIDKRRVILNLRPFLGSYEDFLAPASFSADTEDEETLPRGGMFEDLQQYWTRERSACFNPRDPSIQSLAYYTLNIIAAEWVKYVAVMQYCLKQYEYNHDQLPALSLDKFDKDLRELQSWRRRTMVSQSKIKSVLRFLSSKYRQIENKDQDLELLSDDFEHINSNIESVGRRLESMLPVVMSFVQITDARRSFAETADISRLTILALIFVPLTFVSSLFSMNTENLPGRGAFWVYFAVAIPLTGLVVLIARPPVALTRRAINWIVERKKQPIVRRRSESVDSAIKGPVA
ncbi:hypothetical protein BDV96DRAFT_639535 [Lophiotrema nucula]|uniref:Cora-like Mg2+ transporter protein-domain-containing protein n=1 Tax=Lophiotrema nucula TaxID=690887 RepID=A0A6A5ZVI4_9PLEO|nr:hypothetical protein BDV96DRAFT_639535 [Lophiotrema nucula]